MNWFFQRVLQKVKMADLHDPEDDGGAAETHGFRSTQADAVLDDLGGFLARYALPSLVSRSSTFSSS